MSFPETMLALGDPPSMMVGTATYGAAGYCGGCGEYVGPLHRCQPPTGIRVPLKRCCYAVLDGEDCDCAEFLAGWPR